MGREGGREGGRGEGGGREGGGRGGGRGGRDNSSISCSELTPVQQLDFPYIKVKKLVFEFLSNGFIRSEEESP